MLRFRKQRREFRSLVEDFPVIGRPMVSASAWYRDVLSEASSLLFSKVVQL